MLPAQLEDLLCDLNQEGITYAILRLPSNYHPHGGDVDLLIDPDQVSLATACLLARGFILLPGSKPDLHYLFYDNLTDQWIWLHIVTQLSYGNLSFPRTELAGECLRNRQLMDGIYQLSACDSFWELLLHCLIDKGGVSLKYQVRLGELATQHPEESVFYPVINRNLQPELCTDQIVQYVREGAWTRVNKLPMEITRLWRQKNPYLPWRLFFDRVVHTLQKGVHLIYERGISVAIMGPDGAGKSTLITELDKSFIFPVKVVYMGLTGGMLRHIDRLRFPLFVIPLRLMIFWGRFIRAWYYQLHGFLVLFDRYIYDYKVPTPYDQTRLQRFIRWIDGHSLPAPDLVLVLNAPGEIMYQRKGEYNPKMLEDWRQHFLALEVGKSNIEQIDTSGSIEEMRLEATGKIWFQYIKHWKKTSIDSRKNHE